MVRLTRRVDQEKGTGIMYEITVIESTKDWSWMSHQACDDDEIERRAEWIYANENRAVASGAIETFTVICEFQQFNKVEYYSNPSYMKENK
jgi:hypothetical protein